MSKILFCEYTNITWLRERLFDAHAEGFIKALTMEGNDVLGFVCNDLIHSMYDNKLKFYYRQKMITAKIKEFDPDIIISYNNVLPGGEEIIKVTDCPIVVYPADVYSLLADKELIKHHIDRYYFLDSTSVVTKTIKKNIPDLPASHIIPFGHATMVQKLDISQDIDISFVGSLCNYSKNISNYFSNLYKYVDADCANKEKELFFNMYEKHMIDDNDVNGFDFIHGRPKVIKSLKTRKNYEVNCMLASNRRFKELDAISDLGLQIFGYPPSWGDVALYSVELFKCFNYHTAVTLSDSDNIYNRSKCSVNLSQGTTTEGFSWRVPDILASNAVLLSCKKGDLVRLMKPYYNDFPMFESTSELRELAIKLLKEENWRTEIIEASHRMVSDNFRYPRKLKNIERTIGVKLCNISTLGSCTIMTDEDIYKYMGSIKKIVKDMARYIK